MSEQQGLVSLWTGTADSADALESYMAFQFTEDGDAILPSFASSFHIEWFDEDFREAEYFKVPSRLLSELLHAFSYDETIIPRFVQILGETLDDTVNAVVLLYNFNYEGSIGESAAGAVQLRFQGTVRYE